MSDPLSQCTITGTWPETNGEKATGRYLVTPVFEALGSGVLVPVTEVVIRLDANGTGSQTLGYIPGVTQWRITEKIEDATNPRPYLVTPDGPTLDLSTAPRDAPPGSPSALFVLASSIGQVGGPGGPIGQDGTLPPEQIPAGSGDGVAAIGAANPTIVISGTGANPLIGVGTGIPQGSVSGLSAALTAKAAAADLTAETERAQVAEAALVPLATVTAKGDLIIGAGAGTVTRVPVGVTDGTALVVDSAAPEGVSYQPVGGGVKAFTRKVFEVPGASVTPPDSGGIWVPLTQTDGVSLFSASVPAAIGDLITVNQNNMFKATDSATHLDLGVIVGGQIARYLSNGDLPARPSVEGDPGWYPNSPDFKYHPAPPEWIAQADDIDAGTITVALVYRGGTGILYAEADYPFRLTMKNLGVPTTVVV